MNTIALYDKVCSQAGRYTTRAYSTSFSLGIRSLDKRFRTPIHSIYGFVRFADEIVDTFHEHDKRVLMARFRKDTYGTCVKTTSSIRCISIAASGTTAS